MSSNTSVVPFSFESHEIRTLSVDGNLYFVAKDIAEVLEYSWKGSATIGHVPEEWRGVYSVQTPSGVQEMQTLSEQGLYFFLNRSDKPKALPLQKWVAGEVLPSIRKTGSYSIHVSPPEPPFVALPIENGMRVFTTADIFARNVLKLVGNQALLSANQATYKALGVDVLDHFDQKALPADKRGKTFTQTELGRCFFNLPINARQMGILLNVAGLQNRIDDHWEPTEKAAGLYEWLDTGKWHHSGTPVKQLKWFKQVIDHPDFVTALIPRNTINKRINPSLPDQSTK